MKKSAGVYSEISLLLNKAVKKLFIFFQKTFTAYAVAKNPAIMTCIT